MLEGGSRIDAWLIGPKVVHTQVHNLKVIGFFFNLVSFKWSKMTKNVNMTTSLLVDVVD